MEFLNKVCALGKLGVGTSPIYDFQVCASATGTWLTELRNTSTNGSVLLIRNGNDVNSAFVIANTGFTGGVTMTGAGDALFSGNVCVSALCSSGIVSGTTVCSTTSTKTPTIQLTNVAAKTTETRIAYIKTDGTILSGTTGGGTINWSGSTTNGVATYISPTCICSNPSLTFAGNNLTLDTVGTNRLCIAGYVNGTTVGSIISLLKSHSAAQILACTQNGDFYGQLIYQGVNSSAAITSAAVIEVLQDGAAGATFIPGQMRVRMGTGAAFNEVLRLCYDGSLCTSGYLCSPVVYGTTSVKTALVSGSTAVCSALVCGATSVKGALICGTNICGATSVRSALVSGSTAVCSALVVASTCVSTPIVDSAANIAICSSADIALCGIANSCTVLYYNGSARLVTLSAGVCVNGVVSASTASCAVTCLMAGTCVCAGTSLCAAGCGFAVDFVASSDCRLKTDIQPISNALSMVTRLQGVCYHLCDDEYNEMRVGLIAQDVEYVIPEIVSYSKPNGCDLKYGIDDSRLGLKYDKLTAVLVEAIKEQQQQIICLQEEISELKKK